MKRTIVTIMMVLFVSSWVYAGDSGFENFKAKRAKSKHEKTVKKAQEKLDKAQKQFNETKAEADKDYKEDLEDALKDAMKKGDLEEANKIKAALDKEAKKVDWVVGEWKNDARDVVEVKEDGTYENKCHTGKTLYGTWKLVDDMFIIEAKDGSVNVLKKLNKDKMKRVSKKGNFYWFR